MLRAVLRWVACAAAVVFLAVLGLQAWFYAQILYLNAYDPASTAFMDRRLEAMRAKDPKAKLRHEWVPYERISTHLKRAVVAAEDAKFLDHEGFDWEAIQKALARNEKRGRVVAGGSTISQQLAKNLFLSGERSYVRKLQEALITWMLERTMSKRRILELYLNVIEWGDGVYGADAAARTYFRVSASALSPEQAALLAGAIINPRVYSPAAPPRRLLARQQLILRRMGVVARAPKTAAPAQTAPAQAPAGPSTEVELPSEEQKTPANPGENEESDGGAADALAERTRIR